MSSRRPLGFIVFAVVLMGGAVWIVGELFRQASSSGNTSEVVRSEAAEPLSAEAGQFQSLEESLRTTPPSVLDGGRRGLDVVYERRAFPGAPPYVPHEVDQQMPGAEGCLSCHQYGGWAPVFEAHAPRTPHPQYTACRQCHVVPMTEALFASTDWSPAPRPQIKRPALPGSPPPIPHELAMRGNCLSCHAGPAATFEVRTSHPERTGCLQCHVPQVTDGSWIRASGG